MTRAHLAIAFLALAVSAAVPWRPATAQEGVEERLADLERRVAALEQILARLTGSADTAAPAGEPTVVDAQPIAIRLISKRFTEGRYEDYLQFEFEFASSLTKPVRAFTGVVVFQDLFDRDITRVNLTIEDPLPVGGTVRWEGGIDYNQFMDTHQRLRSIAQSDLQARFELSDVIYQDGTRQQFKRS